MSDIPQVDQRDWLTEGELAARLGYRSKDWFSRIRRAHPEKYPPVATHLSMKPLKFMKADVESFIERGNHND